MDFKTKRSAPIAEIKRPAGVLENPNFQRWFSGSKVVDGLGTPLVVYHGTKQEFTTFDHRMLGMSSDHPASGLGFQFTDNKDAALEYASLSGGTKVIEVFLAMKKPKVYSTRQYLRIMDDLENGNDNAADLSARLKEKGYDGIIAVGDEYDGTHFIVFDPRQIKSASANDGSFDPGNPDITK